MRIRRKHALGFIAIALLVGGISGVVAFAFYQNERYHLIDEAGRQLSSISELKVNQLLEWRRERTSDGAFYFRNADVATQIATLSKNPRAGIRQEASDLLNAMYRNGQYVALGMFDQNGNDLVTIPEGTAFPQNLPAELIHAETHPYDVTFSDMFTDDEQNPRLAIVAPIFSSTQRTWIGSILLLVDPNTTLYPLIQKWPVPSETGETVIAQLQSDRIAFLAPLHKGHHQPRSFTLPLTQPMLPAAQAALGKRGVYFGRDYAGDAVLSVIRDVPGFGWVIVCKMDWLELSQPLKRDVVMLTLIAVLASLTVIFLLLGLWRNQNLKYLRKDAVLSHQLRQLNRTYAVLSEINQAIVVTSDADELLHKVCRVITTTGGFPLTWISLPDESGQQIVPTYIEINSDCPVNREFIPHTINAEAGGPTWLAYQEARMVIVDNISLPSIQKPIIDQLIGLGIQAEITVPILAPHQRVYVVTIFARETGYFDDEEQKLLRELSEDIGYALNTIDQENQRRQLEQSLSEAMERYKAVVEQANDGIFLCDDQAKYIEVNLRGCEMLGYTRNEIVGMNMRDIIVPDTIPQMEANLRRMLRGESVINERLLRKKDGSYLEVEISAREIEGDYILGMVRDVSERKKIERELRESEQRFREVVERSPDAIFIQTHQCFAYLNPQALVMFGAETPEQLLGSPVVEHFHPDFRAIVAERIHRLNEQHESMGILEERILRRDGSTVDAEISGVPFVYQGEHGALVFVRDLTQRKEAERALRESEQMYRSLFENMLNGFVYCEIVYDEQKHPIDFYYLACNPAFETMTGLHDVVGKTITEAIPGIREKDPDLIPMHTRIAETGVPEHFEMWVESLHRWYATTLYCPRPGAFVSIFDDISDRKQAEIQVRENEERFRELFERNRSGIAIFQPKDDGNDFVVQSVNPAGEYITGAQGDEMVGQSLLELNPHWAETEVFKTLRKIYREKEPITIPEHYQWVARKPGWREIFVYRLPSGELVVVFDDVTERHEALAKLKQIEWLLRPRNDLSAPPPAIYGDLGDYNTDRTIINAVGKETLQTMVSEFLALLGTSAAIYEKNGDYAVCVLQSNWCREMDEQSYRRCKTHNPLAAIQSGDWLCRESCRVRAVTVALESGQAVDTECAGGLRLYTIPIRAEGSVIGAIHIAYGNPPNDPEKLEYLSKLYDIPLQRLQTWSQEYETRPAFIIDLAKERLQNAARMIGLIVELRNAEEQVRSFNLTLEGRVSERTRQLEAANRELEAFSYSVSHDLRAPLRAISGFSDILVEDYGSALEEGAQRVLNIIRDNTRRMGMLIDDLLSFSRISRQEMKSIPIDMAVLAREVFKELAGSSTALQFQLNDIPTCMGDPTLIRQVWVNLLSNAVKFTSKTESPRIEVLGREENGEFLYEVKDNGVGFDQKYVDKLFGTFQRLHSEHDFEGTGIGLALVKRIVQRHHGRVWALGQLNRGATFGFSLPINQGGQSDQ